MFLKFLLVFCLFAAALGDVSAAAPEKNNRKEEKQSKKKRNEKKRSKKDDKKSKEPQDKTLPAREDNWRRGPNRSWELHLTEAIEKAKTEKKLLYVVAIENNKECRELKTRVLGSSRFKRFAETSFVLLYIDMDGKDQPSSQKTHNVNVKKQFKFGSKMPSAVIVDPSTKKQLAEIKGVKTPRDYVENMRKYVK